MKDLTVLDVFRLNDDVILRWHTRCQSIDKRNAYANHERNEHMSIIAAHDDVEKKKQ